jgi:hypothetical protein
LSSRFDNIKVQKVTATISRNRNYLAGKIMRKQSA